METIPGSKVLAVQERDRVARVPSLHCRVPAVQRIEPARRRPNSPRWTIPGLTPNRDALGGAEFHRIHSFESTGCARCLGPRVEVQLALLFLTEQLVSTSHRNATHPLGRQWRIYISDLSVRRQFSKSHLNPRRRRKRHLPSLRPCGTRRRRRPLRRSKIPLLSLNSPTENSPCLGQSPILNRAESLEPSRRYSEHRFGPSSQILP